MEYCRTQIRGHQNKWGIKSTQTEVYSISMLSVEQALLTFISLKDVACYSHGNAL
jgi:hypothetical protein